MTAFFDDPRFLRTVVAEKDPATSAREALGAVRLAGCAPGARVLDAGCGNGRHALVLAGGGYRVSALDTSALLLAAAREAAGDMACPRFVHGSYAALPFAEASFDAVLCLGTALGYLSEAGDRAALREFRRVLAPAGRLVIDTMHRGAIGVAVCNGEERPLADDASLSFERRFDPARGVLRETQRLRDGANEAPPRGYDLRVYAIDELRAMLERAGLAVIASHASLEGEGEPSPETPLVSVSAPDQQPARGGRRRRHPPPTAHRRRAAQR